MSLTTKKADFIVRGHHKLHNYRENTALETGKNLSLIL